MSQNNDVPANQNEEALQAPLYHNFVQPSIQQTNEHNQIQQSYVQVPNQHVLNQPDMYYAPRPMLTPFAEPPFIRRQNIPPQGYNVNANRAITPPIRAHNFRTSNMQGRVGESSRGSSSRARGEAIPNAYMENHQYPNAQVNIEPPRNPQIIPNYDNPYDPRYAENGLPVDPFLRMLTLNPNFDNTGAGNN